MNEVTVLKLKNGETLIAGVRQAEDNMFWIDDPIQVVPMQVTQDGIQGETFLLKPWIGISSDKSFLLSAREILTTCSLKENLLEQYRSYVGVAPPVQEQDSYDELELLQSRILRSRNLLN